MNRKKLVCSTILMAFVLSIILPAVSASPTTFASDDFETGAPNAFWLNNSFNNGEVSDNATYVHSGDYGFSSIQMGAPAGLNVLSSLSEDHNFQNISGYLKIVSEPEQGSSFLYKLRWSDGDSEISLDLASNATGAYLSQVIVAGDQSDFAQIDYALSVGTWYHISLIGFYNDTDQTVNGYAVVDGTTVPDSFVSMPSAISTPFDGAELLVGLSNLDMGFDDFVYQVDDIDFPAPSPTPTASPIASPTASPTSGSHGSGGFSQPFLTSTPTQTASTPQPQTDDNYTLFFVVGACLASIVAVSFVVWKRR